MEKLKILFPAFFSLLLSCHSSSSPSKKDTLAASDSLTSSMNVALKKAGNTPDDIDLPWYDLEGWLDSMKCERLHDRSVLLAIATGSGLHYEDGDLDTSNVQFFNGHFTNKDSVQTLVLMGGYGIPSCGDGCNKVLLFSCDPKVHLLWAGQMPGFGQSDLRDLDNDGVLDIVTTSGVVRMGECADYYTIQNLKNRTLNEMYSSTTHSSINCGENYTDIMKMGDTIVTIIHDSLMDPDHDHIYFVRSYRSYLLFNGGKTEEEAEHRAIRKTAILEIPLKSF